MEAARWGYDGVVALLLSSPGIRVNTKDQFDQTALHMVCRNYDFLHDRSLACLPLLLARPDLLLNERNDWGFTPIMSAILGRQTEAVFQMASVPDVCLDVKDNKGRSLEEIARLVAGEAAPAIVQVLEEARQRRRLLRLIKEQKAKVGKVLMDGLYDPNSNLSLLRMPAVKSPLMKMIWDKVTEDWQVFNDEAP